MRLVDNRSKDNLNTLSTHSYVDPSASWTNMKTHTRAAIKMASVPTCTNLITRYISIYIIKRNFVSASFILRSTSVCNNICDAENEEIGMA